MSCVGAPHAGDAKKPELSDRKVTLEKEERELKARNERKA